MVKLSYRILDKIATSSEIKALHSMNMNRYEPYQISSANQFAGAY